MSPRTQSIGAPLRMMIDALTLDKVLPSCELERDSYDAVGAGSCVGLSRLSEGRSKVRARYGVMSEGCRQPVSATESNG
jgi:hypothetical protein